VSNWDEPAIIHATRRWVSGVVVDLNLCPFARRVNDSGRVRYTTTTATDVEALLVELRKELQALVATPREQLETTLLIHPAVLGEFADYNDFLPEADQLLRDLGLEGVIQIASFHPNYQFAETAVDAAENYTNRSPYPVLHLLREVSITELADDPELLDAIPKRNIATLRKLGRVEMLARLRATMHPPID
jgi:uncharacterized protein